MKGAQVFLENNQDIDDKIAIAGAKKKEIDNKIIFLQKQIEAQEIKKMKCEIEFLQKIRDLQQKEIEQIQGKLEQKNVQQKKQLEQETQQQQDICQINSDVNNIRKTLQEQVDKIQEIKRIQQEIQQSIKKLVRIGTQTKKQLKQRLAQEREIGKLYKDLAQRQRKQETQQEMLQQRLTDFQIAKCNNDLTEIQSQNKNIVNTKQEMQLIQENGPAQLELTFFQAFIKFFCDMFSCVINLFNRDRDRGQGSRQL